MSVNSGEEDYAPYRRDRDAEEKLLDRFRDPNDPLKIIIVTSKLLTGFDAPILQTMYLDRPLRDHTLLQAICRTNRPYGQQKTHGLIVDYLGIFDDVAQALEFDEEGITRVVSNIAELREKLPEAIQKCLEFFPGVDRTVAGYEGLMAAQDCLPNNDVRDRYAENCSYLMRLWEAISPDPILNEYETDYRWLVQVYESVKPVSPTGHLLWHRLGAKTVELIHENVHVDAVRDDLDTLVVDADLLEAVLGTPDPTKKAKEIEIKVIKRLRKHLHDPRFKALAERLEDLKTRHEQGLLLSVAFLKELLDLAKDVVATEHVSPPIEQEDRGKAALTELFEDAKNGENNANEISALRPPRVESNVLRTKQQAFQFANEGLTSLANSTIGDVIRRTFVTRRDMGHPYSAAMFGYADFDLEVFRPDHALIYWELLRQITGRPTTDHFVLFPTGQTARRRAAQ
jgi:type I restriction enzyme R subunit